jgi:hypothetical protein
MTVILTPTGFKTAPKGKVVNDADKAAALFGSMPKGEARKLRRQLSAIPEVRRYASVRRAA